MGLLVGSGSTSVEMPDAKAEVDLAEYAHNGEVALELKATNDSETAPTIGTVRLYYGFVTEPGRTAAELQSALDRSIAVDIQAGAGNVRLNTSNGTIKASGRYLALAVTNSGFGGDLVTVDARVILPR